MCLSSSISAFTSFALLEVTQLLFLFSLLSAYSFLKNQQNLSLIDFTSNFMHFIFNVSNIGITIIFLIKTLLIGIFFNFCSFFIKITN